jgi:colanic acid/amylovoran biosynthesis glycosyltransferase
MRIAVFVGSFPAVSETFILHQITGLLDLGHDVDIYADCPPPPDAPLHPEIEKYGLQQRTTYINAPPESIPYELSAWPMSGVTWLPGAPESTHNFSRLTQALPAFGKCLLRAPRLTAQAVSPSHYGYQAASLSTLYRLAQLTSVKKRYDILHAHFGPIGNSYRFVKSLWRAPLVISFHGYDFSSIIKKSGADVYRPLFSTADAVTVNSDFMHGKLVECGCPPEKIRKQPYGVDLGQISKLNEREKELGPVRILTIGRLVEKKGIEYSIRAFAEARKSHPEIHYDIVGDGPLRAMLQQLIADLNVADGVTLHGAKDGPFVRDVMARADLFVLTSVTATDGDQEGTPVSILEAQAAGLPVISTRHSGIPEILRDGVAGFLVPERNVEAISQQLSWFVQHREARKQMGEAGRKFIGDQFDQAGCLKKLLSIYETLGRSEQETLLAISSS